MDNYDKLLLKKYREVIEEKRLEEATKEIYAVLFHNRNQEILLYA